MSESAFARYLDTNYTPTPEDVSLLKSMIKETWETVARIDKELQGYHQLLEERKACISSIERHSKLLAPMRRLPDDILMAIFYAFIDLPAHQMAKMGSNHPSVVLSHVCGRWRQVALGDPRLWSSIHVRTPFSPFGGTGAISRDSQRQWTSTVERLQELTRIWIVRSAAYPLTFSIGLSIDNESTVQEEELTRYNSMISILCTQAFRWKAVTFAYMLKSHAHQVTLEEPIRALTARDVPLLRSLALRLYHLPSPPRDSPQPSLGIVNGEALQSLELCIPAMLSPESSIPRSWEGLTHLCLLEFNSSGHGDNQFLDILIACPMLASCDIELTNPYLPLFPIAPPNSSAHLTTYARKARDSTNPLIHRHLKSLTVKHKTPSRALAEALILPSLETLRIPSCPFAMYGEGHAEAADVEALVFWFKKFGPQLTEACFPASHIPDEPLVEILESLDNVVTMRLAVEKYFAQVDEFPQSAVRPLKPSWFPKLQILQGTAYDEERYTAFTEESLLEFIAAHRPPMGVLSTVDFALADSLPTMDLGTELRARGVDVDGLVLKVTYGKRPQLYFNRLAEDPANVETDGWGNGWGDGWGDL